MMLSFRLIFHNYALIQSRGYDYFYKMLSVNSFFHTGNFMLLWEHWHHQLCSFQRGAPSLFPEHLFRIPVYYMVKIRLSSGERNQQDRLYSLICLWTVVKTELIVSFGVITTFTSQLLTFPALVLILRKCCSMLDQNFFKDQSGHNPLINFKAQALK